MSILAKKGQRALTLHHQKRHKRTLLTRRRWRAWRHFVHYTQANSRSPMDRAFRVIVGRRTQAERDESAYRRAVGRR